MSGWFQGVWDTVGSAYQYMTGTELAQKVMGRNRRGAEYTEGAQANWERNAAARGRAMATMERVAEDELRRQGIPTTGRARSASRRSGTYVEVPYVAANGSTERLAHFSAHPVGGPGSKIGPFHAKAETAGQPVYEARSVARYYGNNPGHSNLPTHGNEFVGIKPRNFRNRRPPAPPVTSHTPGAFSSLGHAYSAGLEQHVLERNRRNPQYRGRGGDKRRKTSKRKHTRKGRTRRR